jgi:hypothetical protein
VDDLPLDEAASILEIAAERLPTKKLIDGRRADCINCGRTLAMEQRAWQQGLCDNCYQPQDCVASLDTAFRTETRDYNQFGRDTFDRFPEWHAISNEICKRYNVFRVDRDHWERFLNECQTDLGIDRERLLEMRRVDLVAGFGRPLVPPPASLAEAPAPHDAKGTPGRDETKPTELEREVESPPGDLFPPGNAAPTPSEIVNPTDREPATAVMPIEETPLARTLRLLGGSSKAKSLVKFLDKQPARKATLKELTRQLHSRGHEPTRSQLCTAKQLIRRTAATLDQRKAPLRIQWDWDRDEIEMAEVAAR